MMTDKAQTDTNVNYMDALKGPTIELESIYLSSDTWHVHRSLLNKHLPLLVLPKTNTKMTIMCGDCVLRALVHWLYRGQFELDDDGVIETEDLASAWNVGERYGAHVFRDLAMQRLWDMCIDKSLTRHGFDKIDTYLVYEVCKPLDADSGSILHEAGHLYQFILKATAYLWDSPDNDRVANDDSEKSEWEDLAKKHPKFHNDLVFLLAMPRNKRKEILGKVEDYLDPKPSEKKPLARKASERYHVDLISDEEAEPPKRIKIEKSPNIKQEGA